MAPPAGAGTKDIQGELPDSAIVALALHDPRAFGELFDRYWNDIFKFCYYRLGDWHRAEDVASQVFLEAIASLRTFDARIDLYAVGIVLYESLTGTRAFSGKDPHEVLVKILAKDLLPLRALRPDVPAPVERVVMRATMRDPRLRYRTAGEFQHDLLEARTAIRLARVRASRVA